MSIQTATTKGKSSKQEVISGLVEEVFVNMTNKDISKPPDMVFYGANLIAQTNTDPEFILSGPAGTGKTRALLYKMHTAALSNPKYRGLILRKVRKYLYESTLKTYEEDILGRDHPMLQGTAKRGAGRSEYIYPNGARIVVGGMAEPGEVLSSEYDHILASETVQFTESDWMLLSSRLGRSSTGTPSQILGDTNPDHPKHWILQRASRIHPITGKPILTHLATTHKDNPAYWNIDLQEWTELGRNYLNRLESLSGILRAKYLDGLWTIAEGMVYDAYDSTIHVINSFQIPNTWRRIRAIDFGFTNPFSCLWIAISPDDGTMYVYREIYMSRKRVDEHARLINSLTGDERIEATISDHDSGDRAELASHGIATVPAKKDIIKGIQAVQRRLTHSYDTKPRLYFFNDSLVEVDLDLLEAKRPIRLIDEIYPYRWHVDREGKLNKEVPIDFDNHALDALRYAVVHEDNRKGGGFMAFIPVKSGKKKANTSYRSWV